MAQFTKEQTSLADGWEKSGARIPGWHSYRRGKASRYESPSGAIIGEQAYRTLLKQFRLSGISPDIQIDELQIKQPEQSSQIEEDFFTPEETQENNRDLPKQQKPNPVRPAPKVEQPPVIELPEAVLTPGKKQQGKATAKELQGTFAAWLGIGTSFLAMLARSPELVMTMEEMKAISVPLANLFEKSKLNDKFGKAIVGSNDYVLLGYALYSYLFRVQSTMKARSLGVNIQSRSPQPAPPPIGHSGAESAGAASSNGVHLHSAPAGLRGFTPLS